MHDVGEWYLGLLVRLGAALFWQDGHFRLAVPSDKTRQLCSAYLVYLSWSAAARPGSCCLVRNSELWQGLRWLNCPKPEPSAATQSNKSSKERWCRARQTNSPLLFFLSFFFFFAQHHRSLFWQQEAEWKREAAEEHWHRQAQRGDPPTPNTRQDPLKRIYCRGLSWNTSCSVSLCGQWFHSCCGASQQQWKRQCWNNSWFSDNWRGSKDDGAKKQALSDV